MTFSHGLGWLVALVVLFLLYVLGAPVVFVATHRHPREVELPPYMKPYAWIREHGPEELMRAYEAWWLRYYGR
jgi:hypothetical protein